MNISVQLYTSQQSPLHDCDARVKILLLAAYSLTLFLLQTWVGLGVALLLFVILAAVARLPFSRVFVLLTPVYVFAFFSILFNSFTFDIENAAVHTSGLSAVSSGVFALCKPVALLGSFGFVPAGCAQGCFYALRILLLVAASFVVCASTSSTSMTQALASFLEPLRALRVPVDDVATICSLALRFIPVTAEEFQRVYVAQYARGASFDAERALDKLRAWVPVFIPLFVGMFRRADALAEAMEARCYGASKAGRTHLYTHSFSPQSALILTAGCVLCFTLAVLL